MRRLFRLMAFVMTLAVLAGCSSSGDTKNSTATKTPDKPVELVVYSTLGLNREALDEVIDAYESAHTNVKVKVKELQGGQFFQQGGTINTAAFEGGDVVFLPNNTALQFHQSGALRDLSAVRLPQLNDLVAGLYDDLSKLDGKRYALPFSITPAMMMINPEALAKAGINSLPADWTVQDFQQTLTALKAAGVTVNIQMNALLDPMVRAYGGELYDAARQIHTLDTAETKAALTYLGGVAQTGMVVYEQAGQAMRIEIGGRNAAAITAFGGNFAFGGGRGPGGPNIAYQPYPKGPKGRSVSVSATVGSVLSTATNPEVAIDFLKEMVSSPAAQKALAAGGIRPISNDAKALAAWQESVGDKVAQVTELSLQGAYVASSGAKVNEIITGLNTFWKGTASLDSVLPGVISTVK